MKFRYFLTSIFFAFSSCVHIDPVSVQAKAGAPASADVADINIPLDSTKPIYSLVVESISIPTSSVKIDSKITKEKASEESTVTISRSSDERGKAEIDAQLVSALAGVGNFRVIDAKTYRENPAAITAGNDGIYVVRALMTEYATMSEGQSQRINYFPFGHYAKNAKTGMCAFDISITEAKTGVVVGSFRSAGTFASQKKSSSQGIVLPIAQQHVFAQSVLDQATRVALNEAAVKARETLFARRP
ncbi:hypothetical protein JNK13_07600 [bacterium]|nr:hypothetical protein [bacterium]